MPTHVTLPGNHILQCGHEKWLDDMYVVLTNTVRLPRYSCMLNSLLLWQSYISVYQVTINNFIQCHFSLLP